MRATTKGQVTVPLDVRKAQGIVPGTEPTFRVRGARIEVEKTEGGGRGDAVVRRLRAAPRRSGMSTDELPALTRNPPK